jgi:uncharacterized protein (TIGR02996 family)
MDEMIPFLRTIAANPDDDTPRLVFADWLDEHKHHERAEFIRLQIELARMDTSDASYPEKTARMRRCGVFTTKGMHRFFDHLPTEKCKIAFHRGFIESINTADADEIDTSGFDLIPLLTLRTGDKLIDKFKEFTNLKRLEYSEYSRSGTPERLLEILGPKGWFKNLEELSLPYLSRACLEAGVIPQFDLPKLRNFFLSTDAFYELGVFVESDSDEDEDDDYGEARAWSGLPDYLPRNAIPNKKSPLERFVWHTNDDSDLYGDGDRFWAGPTMESLLTHLRPHKLKQVEVAVDWDDHENGSEGVDAAAYQQNPLKLCPTLEHVTLDNRGLRLLEGSTQKLKTLRVYAAHDLDDHFFSLLAQPVCSELESLHVEVRGWWRDEPTNAPSFNFSKLKSLSGLLADFSNSQFPNLVSLRDAGNLKTVLERKWPKLQNLSMSCHNLSGLKALVQSDCCPNLTTLTIEDHYGSNELDISFLANCQYMPFLSLIRIPYYRGDLNYVVDEGRLIPVRSDVMLHEQKPTTVYRISEVF